MLATPENTMNTPPPTNGSSPTRSTASARWRAGGTDSRRGHTTQSLAASSGIDAMPVATCTPCVTRYKPTGRVGIGNQLWGCCCRWENRPVKKQVENRMPNATPRTAARRSSLSGEV
jgi:hypothetical protein